MPVITNDGDASLVNKILLKYEKLKAYRSANWESHWKELSYYVIPQKDEIYGNYVDGDKKENKLYDCTGVHANELLASALHSMLTNPSSVWFGLTSGVLEIDRRDDVRKYLQACVNLMIGVLNNSNFQTEVHEVYLDLGGFGTALFRVEEDEEMVVRFSARPIYEACVSENFKGLIDTVYYEYEMTLEQIKGQFGEEVFDGEMLEAYKANPIAKEKVLHAIEPRNTDINAPSIPKNLPFASYHILMKSKKLLKESGFHESPNIVPRFTKLSGEMFGRSPAMKALADIKMLNSMKKATIEAAQVSIFPPLQVPDDGVLLPIKTRPNSINYYRAGSKDRIEPLNTGSNIGLGENMMEIVRKQIKEAFFIDQLITPENDRMTATEILQRREEQLRALGPILGRMHFEFLRPLIDRVFNIMQRNGLLPKAPEIIANKKLDVVYTSMIAKAQRTIEAGNFDRAIAMIAPVANAQPEILDNIDGNALVKYASDIYGLPQELVRSDMEVKSIRRGRQQAQQEQISLQDQEAQVRMQSELQKSQPR